MSQKSIFYTRWIFYPTGLSVSLFPVITEHIIHNVQESMSFLHTPANDLQV